MTCSIDHLLRPNTVAIVGASDNADRIGGRPIQYMLSAGFKGRLYAVNPGRKTVQGLQAYPDIAAVPPRWIPGCSSTSPSCPWR